MTTTTLQTLAAKAAEQICANLGPQPEIEQDDICEIILAALEQVHSAATEGATVAKGSDWPKEAKPGTAQATCRRLVMDIRGADSFEDAEQIARSFMEHIVFKTKVVMDSLHPDQPTPPTVQPEAATTITHSYYSPHMEADAKTGIIPPQPTAQAGEDLVEPMNSPNKRMRSILRGLLESAKFEAADILSDPTWNLDYLFGFKLTVSDLRAIDRYLAASDRRRSNSRDMPTAQAGETPSDREKLNDLYDRGTTGLDLSPGDRLCLWAYDRITGLERELNEAKAEAARYLNGGREWCRIANEALSRHGTAPTPAALPEVLNLLKERWEARKQHAHSRGEHSAGLAIDNILLEIRDELEPEFAHLASAREDGALRFSVEFAGDKDAGLFPFNDVITIACDSRDWGSLEPEAVDIFTDALKEFYDGATVTRIDAARAKEQT